MADFATQRELHEVMLALKEVLQRKLAYRNGTTFGHACKSSAIPRLFGAACGVMDSVIGTLR